MTHLTENDRKTIRYQTINLYLVHLAGETAELTADANALAESTRHNERIDSERKKAHAETLVEIQAALKRLLK